MWSHDISDLAETRALQTSCFFVDMCSISSSFLQDICQPRHLWLACHVPGDLVGRDVCLCWRQLTWICKHTAAWLCVCTGVCANPALQSPALVVHTHPNSTAFLDVLKPALNFQYGGFHSLRSEKFAQRSAKALKISVHSCFCLKLPIGLWRNTSSLHQLFILEEILAYSQQEVYGFSGERMLACWLASLKFGKWPVTITAVWANRRWRGGLLVSWK